ncbi:MAG: FkbM family methyltransferase [Thermofilum sp.]|nr:FkbM family methyltransferase [Thermofilum sp.]
MAALSRRLRVLLASRRLFGNWLSAGARYYLARSGVLRGGVRVECCSREYVLSPEVYSGIVNAYYDGALEGLECREALYAYFTYGGRKLLFYDSFELLYDIVFEVFKGGAYDELDVRSRTVVDVGAGVGDTAILFALRGARRVVALEPLPSLYRRALVNVRVNGVADRVVLVNAAMGPSDGEVSVEEEARGYRPLAPASSGLRIRVYSLASLIREFGVERGAVLKMDCEGCEYGVLLTARPEDLAVFDQMAIEYHSGYARLKRVLEAVGFETALKPIRSLRVPVEKQGYIVARRKN